MTLVSELNTGYMAKETLRELAPDADITFERIAVLPWQIETWKLPGRPTKTTDSRAKGFSDTSVELDAIEPNRLRLIVELAIENHLPADQLDILKVAEQSEREEIGRLIAAINDAA